MNSIDSLDKAISKRALPFMPYKTWGILLFFLLAIFLGVIITALNPALVLYMTLGIFGALYGLIRPKYGLIIYLVLIPYADFFKRLSLISLPVSRLEWNLIIFVPDLVLISSFIGVLILVFLHNRIRRYNQLDLVVAIFFIWQLISVINPKVPLIVSLAGFKVSALPILVYFIARSTINTWKDIKYILYIILLSAIIPACYGVYQFIFGMNSIEKIWFEGGYTILDKGNLFMFGILRPFSTLSDPGSFSQFLAINFILLIFALVSIRGCYTKLLIILVQGIMLLTLIMTLVRAGWIVLAIGILVLIMLSNRKVYRLVPWLVWGTLVAVPILGKSFQQLNMGGLTNIPFIQRALVTGTFYNRILGWQNALSNPQYRPIFGNGLGSVDSAAYKFGSLTADIPHNQFLIILYEVGLIGLILFILVVVLFYRDSFKHILLKYPDSVNTWTKVIIGIITGLLVMGASVSEFLFLRVIASYFWLFLGLIPREFHISNNSLTEKPGIEENGG